MTGYPSLSSEGQSAMRAPTAPMTMEGSRVSRIGHSEAMDRIEGNCRTALFECVVESPAHLEEAFSLGNAKSTGVEAGGACRKVRRWSDVGTTAIENRKQPRSTS